MLDSAVAYFCCTQLLVGIGRYSKVNKVLGSIVIYSKAKEGRGNYRKL